MDVIDNTIKSNYPYLQDLWYQLKNIDWSQVFKKDDNTNQLSTNEKSFLSSQKGMVLLGVGINNRSELKDHILKIKVDSLNYDELITNINWNNHKKGIRFLLDLNRLSKDIFKSLYEIDSRYTDWTIRSNTIRLFHEMMIEKTEEFTNSDKKFPQASNHRLLKISEEIECSIMLCTVLLCTENCDGDLKSISWKNGLIKAVYLSKANCILSSLTNTIYSGPLFEMLIKGEIVPIEIAFMKRSQLLSKRYEALEINRLKIYDESGLSLNDEDYTLHNSTVRCPKCKLFHTSYSQLQTRGADEPMTIFYYCHGSKL